MESSGSTQQGAAAITIDSATPSALTDELRKGFAGLSPRQADCLRLVGKGFQSKEIARIQSVATDRVNKLIYAALKKLGILTRREAGRLFLEWEAEQDAAKGGTHLMGAHSMALPPAVNVTPTGDVDHGAQASAQGIGPFGEEQVIYSLSPAAPERFDRVPMRHSGRLANDLSSITVLSTVVKLMLAALFAVGSALSMLASLSQIARH